MSLYIEASRLLSSGSGSLKSRIFNHKPSNGNGNSNSKQIYALITESTKYDLLLSEIITHADLLTHEPKLTPTLAVLLVHDFLLSKNGIAAAAQHPLRLAIERQKSRLKAEFIKSRVRRACATVDELKTVILREKGLLSDELVYPRWVRVNTIRSSLEEQFETTFEAYEVVQSLAELAPASKTVFIDPHVPDLLAVPAGTDFSTHVAYRDGKIILQDKASCFPAYLLAGEWDAEGGDMVDGCAAPGNKTTHLAALAGTRPGSGSGSGPADTGIKTGQIIAMDASAARSKTLAKMVATAGADVTILPGQDFLALDPADSRFANVTALLLDPSCSGSGIIGRDDVQLVLPEVPGSRSKKRPREPPAAAAATPADTEGDDRLIKLSNLQTHIVEHALSFPAARRITYSTCSTHEIENEAVVARVLRSDIAQQRGWRVLRRDEQPSGLRRWEGRGQSTDSSSGLDADDLEGCLRCFPGDEQGVGGFFVVGFIRDDDSDSDDEWNGFSD